MKDFLAKAKIFVMHNWKKAITFVAILVAIVAIVVLCELYQYLALTVWASTK